jgi:hypothetical protein
MAFSNRWLKLTPSNQRKFVTYCTAALVAVGCVFGAGGFARAATLDIQMQGAADGMIVNTDLTWQISNNGLLCNLSTPGAQQFQGGYSETLIGQNVKYLASTKLNNTEIIQQDTARLVSFSNGAYQEESLYQSFGQSGNPGIVCGQFDESIASNSNITATAFQELVFVNNQFGNGMLNYQSEGHMQVLDITPDAVQFQALSTGNTFGSMSAAGWSQAGLENTTTLGYQNNWHQSQSSFGEGQMSMNLQWSSFSQTWDFPETTG